MEDIMNVGNLRLSVFIFLALFAMSSNAETTVAIYGACITPNNARGLCILLDDCPTLKNMIVENISNTARVFLRSSQCGYDEQKVVICCPTNEMKNFTVSTGSNTMNGSALPAQCGLIFTDHILGGEATGLLEHPWTALVEYTKPDKSKDHHCGGSLINTRYVITGAHCVRGRKVPPGWIISGVRLGEWNRTTNPDCEYDARNERDCADPFMDIGVEEVIVHPDYLPGSENEMHDLALLRLSAYVQYNSWVKPICLPIADIVRTSQFEGYVMDIVGWGQTENEPSSETKLKAKVTVWDLARCRAKYAQRKLIITDTQLCAGGEENVDTCLGDSGGPLVALQVVDKRSRYFLAGVVSYGPSPCGLKNWPGVYTRVGAYVDWIRDNLKP